MTKTPETLLPCPFCGDPMEHWADAIRHAEHAGACPIGMQAFIGTKRWNTRAGHLVVRPDAEPTPEQGWRPISAEERLASDILAELVRARMKFPGKNVTFAALVEEVGELATATFEESRDCVRREAVQVAVMAMRMVLDGDHCFDAWREDKGLDPLLPPTPTEEG